MTRKKSQKKNKKKIAISVKNVSKTFQVPHEKVDSVRSAFVNALNTRGQTFEEFHALRDVSFEVRKGEFIGIIGSNGAGKSTLLKILAGVYNPSDGVVEINGLISPFLELGIGFNMELSGRDNVYLNATVLGLTKKQIDKKFDGIVAFAELEQFIDQQLKNYSSGMKSRLAFAVSISANRDILLMDEVLAVGDSRFQEKCLNVFKGYRAQGRTVILVTHGMATVREHCDRALLLDHGKILDIGNVNEVCDAYIFNNLTKDQRAELKKKEDAEETEKKHQKKLVKENEKRNQVDLQKKNEVELRAKREKEDGDRAEDEESKKNAMRKESGVIESLHAYDKSGKILEEITSGEDFVVEVIVNIKKVDKNMVLAVQIFDAGKEYFLCGNNTLRDSFDCAWKNGENRISLTFKNTMFNGREIYCKAVLSERSNNKPNEVVHTYPDTMKGEEKQNIKIIQKEMSGGGIMCIEHKWSKKL